MNTTLSADFKIRKIFLFMTGNETVDYESLLQRFYLP